jgi:hypothetical protein
MPPHQGQSQPPLEVNQKRFKQKKKKRKKKRKKTFAKWRPTDSVHDQGGGSMRHVS